MNVMLVGLASIAAYIAIMIYWISVDRRRDNDEPSAAERRDTP